MAKEATIIPAYIDEAGARGFVRDLKQLRDNEFGLMSALVFEPSTHAEAIQLFTPGFEEFRNARPTGAKLHITDAFLAGNEKWAEVATRVRANFLRLILRMRPTIIYSARRLLLSRLLFERAEQMNEDAKANKRSKITVVGGNRPSDLRIEDNLISNLGLRLDEFGELAGEKFNLPQIELHFDETDRELAKRYEFELNRTKNISTNVTKVDGWDREHERRIAGEIKIEVNAPLRIDTQFLGGVHIVGKEHPLILAADIVANHLYRHLGNLPPDAPLNAPASIAGWQLEARVWGVSDAASEDLY